MPRKGPKARPANDPLASPETTTAAPVSTETTPVITPAMIEAARAAAPNPAQVSIEALTQALVQAIGLTKERKKITAAARKPNTPWTPKDGSPKLKLKRKMYQHGLLINENRIDNETIELLNKVRPGLFCDNWVKVVRRRDKGVDIDYPIKTASQRLKLVNQFGIRDFKELLQRCIDEAANPPKYKTEDELD